MEAIKLYLDTLRDLVNQRERELQRGSLAPLWDKGEASGLETSYRLALDYFGRDYSITIEPNGHRLERKNECT